MPIMVYARVDGYRYEIKFLAAFYPAYPSRVSRLFQSWSAAID